MRPYLVQVKEGSRIALEFGAMGPDSITVAQQHECLCERGQYIRVIALSDTFAERSVRHELEQAQLAEASA